MSARKIEIWHEAGLIDAPTRDRLLAFENERSRPLALWAVFGIGALAIALGLISVVAANWEEVPGLVRLALHLALLAAALAGVFVREARLVAASPWALEALIAIAAVLGLTFFGHLGQVYQTSSPLWVPLAMWLALFGPLLLSTGRGWLSALLVVGGAVYCVWEYNWAAEFGRYAGDDAQRPDIRIAAITSAPIFFAPLGAFLRARSRRQDFWCRIEQLGLVYAVGGASFAAVLASADAFNGEATGPLSAVSLTVHAGFALVAGALVALGRATISGRMAGAIIAGSGVTVLLARFVSGVEISAAIVFMLLWLGVAGAALVAGWRNVFQLAVAAIAIRLIVLSFELASDLLLSGFGLILAGLMILTIAWAAYRVSRQFAPADDDAAIKDGAQ